MTQTQSRIGANFWLALGLIAIGLIVLLDNLEVFDFGQLWRFWPLILVAIGVLKLTGSEYQDRTGALFFIGIGALFLLLSFDVVDWGDIWQFWPLILIAIGVSIIYRRYGSDRESADGAQTGSENRVDAVAIFGGHDRKIAAKNFEGGNITAICGGVKLDLGDAKLSEGQNVLDIFNFCGGTEMYVPADWNVEIKGMPIFGGFDDARRKLPDESSDKKTLVIKGLVIFGGLQIKNA